jgi:antagonist of KipI
VSPPPRQSPVGDGALRVEFGSAIDPEANARVRALDAVLAARPFPGFREAIPAHVALLVVYDPIVCDYATASAAVERAGASASSAEPPRPAALVEVPAVYGGEHGPDLPSLASACGLSPDEVVRIHTSVELTAFMLGFSPGFPYLGLLPPALQQPRRAEPRPRVSPGSVAIAGPFTAVYPGASAGGWHLLGRTSRRLFDPLGDPPCLILPGDRVRFREVPDLAPDESPRRAVRGPVPQARATVEVLEGGLLTSVQDGGRSGSRRLGVPPAGAADDQACRRANAALGNTPTAAALECTLAGPVLRFLASTHFAWEGADLGARLDRDDLGPWEVPRGRAVLARAGNVLRFLGRARGLRAYVALAGGIAVPAVLGSRSTDIVGAFGGLEGRALRPGDVLYTGEPPRPRALGSPAAHETGDDSGVTRLRVVLGPQEDAFTDTARSDFLGSEWTLSAVSDRAGWRLEGKRLAHHGPGEIASEGMVPGCVQVPPSGQPIVIGPDGPTTGGYPKIATVISCDLRRLAQLVPGNGRVRFSALTVEEAQAAVRDAARP